MIPGELYLSNEIITINLEKQTIEIEVANTGDRPIQVGSHYHFFEVNPSLKFEREATYGFRLNIPAGTAIRFEPGQSKSICLVAYGGNKMVYGFRNQVGGAL